MTKYCTLHDSEYEVSEDDIIDVSALEKQVRDLKLELIRWKKYYEEMQGVVTYTDMLWEWAKSCPVGPPPWKVIP